MSASDLNQDKTKPNILLEVKNLEVFFPVKKKKLFSTETRFVRAVDDVSFDIKRAETVGLVGESGSGKTTVGRAILRAIDPTGGDVIFHTRDHDVDVAHMKGEELRQFRKKDGHGPSPKAPIRLPI